MQKIYHKLSSKLILALITFMLVLAAVTTAAITAGFQQTQRAATERSVDALRKQGEETLLQVTRREAQISDAALQEAVEMANVAADYFLAMRQETYHLPDWSLERLVRTEDGAYFDPDPNRRTEIWLDPSVVPDDAIEENLRISTVLEALFPALLAQSPDALGIYYMDPKGATRYYPVIGLADRLPPDLVIREGIFFQVAAPRNNPGGSPKWTPPYIDDAGMGPIVTAAVPIYDGREFLGVLSVDLSLTRLITRLNSLTPTEGSYAFLVDGNGDLVGAPPAALNDLLVGSTFAQGLEQIAASEQDPEQFIAATLGLPLAEVANETFQHTLAAMRLGTNGLAQFELNGRPVLMAHAPLSNVGWSLAVIAPLDELTAEATSVTAAIRGEAATTVRGTLLIVVLFFGLVLVGTAELSRRFLTRPIEQLVDATQTIAAGDLSVRLPVRGRDELSQLSDSFNRMAEQLVQAQQMLEQRVADRTRELSALYDVTAVASQSLDQETVLENSLARVLEVMNCHHACVHLLDEESATLDLVAQQRVAELPDLVHYRDAIAVGDGLVGQVAQTGAPVVASDVVHDPRTVTSEEDRSLGRRAYLGVPMRVKNRVLGVLSVLSEEDRQFSEEEMALLSSIADQVGVAVDNARLYEQAERLGVVEERQRLARELHDSVTQSLYSTRLLAETTRRAASASDLERTRDLAARLGEVAQQALKEMRLLVYELRPAALAQDGLTGALQQRLDAVERRAGIDARLLVEGEVGALPATVEANLYRIVQEALNNALKHAAATAVTVSIASGSDQICVAVEDNGEGFVPGEQSDRGGMGLKSMRERTEQLHGTFTLQSRPGEGTRVEVRLPLEHLRLRDREMERSMTRQNLLS